MLAGNRWVRWLVYGLVGLVLLAVVAVVGVRSYFNSSAGRAMVETKLQDRLGVPIEVTTLDLGLNQSAIGLKLPDATPGSEPRDFVQVRSLKLPVPLADLVSGTIPKSVDADGVAITLYLDEQGKLLTTLPKMETNPDAAPIDVEKFPTVNLTDSQLSFQQVGRPEMLVKGISGTLKPDSGLLKGTGRMDDADWGKWEVSTEINIGTRAGWVELRSPDAPIDLAHCQRIPFVPKDVWQHVETAGRGAVTFRLQFRGTDTPKYDLLIEPNSATIRVTDIDATFTQTTGQVRVADGIVSIVNCKASLASGTLQTTGTLNFQGESSTINLKLRAAGLSLPELPKAWGLPPDLGGNLKGNVELAMIIRPDGTLEPSGGGTGTVENASLRGIPIMVDLALQSSAKGYQFIQPKPKPPGTSHRTTAPVRYLARRPQAPAPPPAAPAPVPTSLEAAIRLSDVSIQELLTKFEVKSAYPLKGNISAELALQVPLSNADDRAAYEFSGTVSSPELTLDRLTIRDAKAKVRYKNGTLTLSELTGQVPDPAAPTDATRTGTLSGKATVAVNPSGDLDAEATLKGVALAAVLRGVPGVNVNAAGPISGTAKFQAPFAKLGDVQTLKGTIALTSPKLLLEGRELQNATVNATLANGTLTVSDATTNVAGLPVKLLGTLDLKGPFNYVAQATTTDTNLTDLQKLLPGVTLPATITGNVQTDSKIVGTLSPLSITGSGTLTTDRLTLAKTTANEVRAAWELTAEKLRIKDLDAKLFGGTLTGSLDYPIDALKTGSFQVKLTDVDASAASLLVPDLSVKLGGKLAGTVEGAIVPASQKPDRIGEVKLNLTAPRLTVQGIPAERLVGKADYVNGSVNYQLEGKTLGGSFEVKGQYPPAAKPAAKGMTLKLTGADLGQLSTELRRSELAPLRGMIDLSFESNQGFEEGSGVVRLRNISWGSTPIASLLEGDLALQDGVFRMRELHGGFAGGLLRLRAYFRIADPRRNGLILSLSNVQAKRVLLPFGNVEKIIDGLMSVNARISIGREIRATGTVELARGTLSGVAVSDLRLPFEVATAIGGSGQLNIHEATARAGNGVATGKLLLDWGTTLRVDGQVKFRDIPPKVMLADLGNSSFLSAGRMSGRMDVEGTNVRSVNDLTGTLIATLNQTTVNELPLLQQAAPYLNPLGFLKPFESGDTRARLNRGVIRFERLALANPGAQIFAEGTITLAGRIDLGVVAHSGTVGPDIPGLRFFGLRLPVFGPIPLSLIQDVTAFLSNRTVRLNITGTVNRPIVRLNTAALLTDEAVRFFLSRYVLPAEVAGSAFGLGSDYDR